VLPDCALSLDHLEPGALKVDPFRNSVIELSRFLQLCTLDYDASSCEQLITAAMVEMKVTVYDNVYVVEGESLLSEQVWKGESTRAKSGVDKFMGRPQAGVEEQNAARRGYEVHVKGNDGVGSWMRRGSRHVRRVQPRDLQ